MNKNTLNICQVSLARDIPIIIENYKSFKKLYNTIKIFIICPKKEINEFRKKLIFEEFNIICEDDLISPNIFFKIYKEASDKSKYKFKKQFKKRLNWYYQQVLKITFLINFIKLKKEKIIIWDSDTIILKKIIFFDGNHSIKYGSLFEFRNEYYSTNKYILKKIPEYYISFLTQFIGITNAECNNFLTMIFGNKKIDNKLPKKISEKIFYSIFKAHEGYNDSLFSEYELLGMCNYKLKKDKQKAILFLRFRLDGKLTPTQSIISKILNFKHVTYEHSHPNKNSQGMLNRSQSWLRFFAIIFKNFLRFHVRNIKHNILYYYNRV
tara:strand:- start:54 stop:1022 length:969 start_codon:yes stop_codon:yes gene_type:complete